jgi:hypothetical protein
LPRRWGEQHGSQLRLRTGRSYLVSQGQRFSQRQGQRQVNVPLSIMILQWCIDACAAWLGATSQSCGSMSAPEVLPPGWQPGWIATHWASGRDRGVSSLCSGKSRLAPRSSSAGGESRASSGVSSWPSLGKTRVCALGLGARVVLQHAGDRLPSGGEIDGACFAGGALVPQLREPTADVPVPSRIGSLISVLPRSSLSAIPSRMQVAGESP